MSLPHFVLGGTGQPLHFLHANGYPYQCYKPLLDRLCEHYYVFGMLLRPLWEGSKPEDVTNWHVFSEDLIHFLTNDRSPSVIGMGHSIGAVVTLRAALRRPEKFRALILIDPVLFVPRTMFLWQIIRLLGLGERFHPLVRGAKKRRRRFDDRETVFRGYRKRRIFRYMSDQSLRDYIEGMTRKTEKGYELVYSPEWEARIYMTNMHDFDIWRELPRLEIPTLILRGAETDTFLENAASLVKRKQPRVRIETVEKSTHLLPLERPQEVFDIVQSFLAES
jgi:pimeloyl-ACP methyl ester carboxylesterase